jgi:hypothetical protein
MLPLDPPGIALPLAEIYAGLGLTVPMPAPSTG